MSIGGHLREFRNRTVIAAVAILLCSIVGWILYDPIFSYLNQPLIDYAKSKHIDPKDVRVNFNGIANAFTMKFKVALWVGFILATPVWLWEIWAFLVPGLTKREKRVARAFIGSAIPLFAAGVYLGTLVYGNTIRLLIGETPNGAVNLPTASEYFSFVSRFILSFGLAFLLPIFLMALNMVKILPGRVMLKGWRIAVIVILTFAAAMTPTADVITMFAMFAPLAILYFGTVAFAMFMDRMRERREEKNRPEWMDVSDDQASPL